VLPSQSEIVAKQKSDSPLSTEHAQIIDRRVAAMKWRRIVPFVAAIALAVAVVDQATKMVVVAWIGPDQAIHRWELVGRLAAFQYVENSGAAFGIFAGRTWLLSALAIVVALGFTIAFWKDLPHSGLPRVSVALVLGGAIGNLFDRVRLGYVVDFVAIGIWPKFNIADCAITIGLILLTYSAFVESPNRESTT